MSEIAGALATAASELSCTSTTPRLDAELLMAVAFGISREQLLLDLPAGLPPPLFAALLGRRRAGEPIAYIIGRRAFWTIELEVGPGALIPRPDSEMLIEAAVTHFAGGTGPARILDLGTGPGTLLFAVLDEWRQATGIGVESSSEALDYARRNARRLGLEQRAELREGNWGEGIDEKFDLVLVNPPYVALGATTGPGVAEHEPAEALFAGADGLDDYRRLAPQLGLLIAPGGLAVIEIGFDQADSAASILRAAGLISSIAHDLAGRPRALLVPGRKLARR